jgi:hypothetical protein
MVERRVAQTCNWGPAQPQADKVIDVLNKIDTLMEQMANATSASTFRVA